MLMSLRTLVYASCYLHLKHTASSFHTVFPATVRRNCRSHIVEEMRRRSPRLLALENRVKITTVSATPDLSTIEENDEGESNEINNKVPVKEKKRKTDSSKNVKSSASKKKSTTKKKKKTSKIKSGDNELFLPRTREEELRENEIGLQVMGIDEAGRGPLAGPVVAAAAIIPENIIGVTDSKKITKEEDREKLYGKIVSSPSARWAVAIVNAQRIDEINILQATLEAMKMAATALISPQDFIKNGGQVVQEASSKVNGSYVVCGSTDSTGQSIDDKDVKEDDNIKYYALIDGNRVPKELPCESEAMVKGDSREYAIGAASILAKVTRDQIMREYDTLYPEYELSRHKGKKTKL